MPEEGREGGRGGVNVRRRRRGGRRGVNVRRRRRGREKRSECEDEEEGKGEEE